MIAIKNLNKRIEKLETVFLFRTGKLFYETLSDEDITRLLHCFTKAELRECCEIQDTYEMNAFVENSYNKYKDILKDIFNSDEELNRQMDEINFYIKYCNSLSKSDQIKLKDNNSKISKRFVELLLIRRKKRESQNTGIHTKN